MLEVIVTYVDKDMPVESFAILTYLRGDGYWQFLSASGSTVSIPDHAVLKIEILSAKNGEES